MKLLACAYNVIISAARAQVSKQLKLRPEHEAPMIEPFLRFGNTSSSSTWCAPGASGHGRPLYTVWGCSRCLFLLLHLHLNNPGLCCSLALHQKLCSQLPWPTAASLSRCNFGQANLPAYDPRFTIATICIL